MKIFVFLQWVILSIAQGQSRENMNGDYLISNPNPSSGKPYSTRYFERPDIEFFDVYSPPISTRYGEVFWTMMDPVPLSPDLVSRFKDKTMAVVGYETDQVMKGDDGNDLSVPITWAYNHHYEAFLHSSYTKMTRVPAGIFPSGRNNHGARTVWASVMDENQVDPNPNSHIPISQFFSEGNGGEFRKSYHGYPAGMAQLIDSPATFHIQPMQIDTKNRDYNGTDFKAGILPKESAAPQNASYSGLLECPCTTRIHKEINITYATQTQGTCDTVITDERECVNAAIKIDPALAKAKQIVVTSTLFPSGCSIVHKTDGTTKIVMNKRQDGATCGSGGAHWLGKSTPKTSTTLVSLSVDLDGSTSTATINMTGPANKWFGVGFGCQTFTMSDQPYAVTVDGLGNVAERKLGDHSGGRTLATSVSVLSNTVVNGVRSVVLKRPFQGQTADHYTFDPKSSATVNVIMASGTGPNYSYHGPSTRGGEAIHLVSLDAPTCVCNIGIKGSINKVPFSKNCLAEPRGDLLQQKNPTCQVDTYAGGLLCCHHQNVLLDADQEQPRDVMTYHLKFRFYFQPYMPASEGRPASHQNLIRLYWQTEASAGEYDVPKADPTTPPEQTIHTITAHWKVKDMLYNCDERKGDSCTGNATDFDGVHLIYAGGHCHAPSCISMELYNADTGRLLCRHDPVYGTSDKVFDELGYLALPPCLWGNESEGLVPPTFLSFDTNLMSIKRNNNTNGHYGEMASWQMRGVMVKAPSKLIHP